MAKKNPLIGRIVWTQGPDRAPAKITAVNGSDITLRWFHPGAGTYTGPREQLCVGYLDIRCHGKMMPLRKFIDTQLPLPK